uniref:Uncharacterized protein n=1 Tax=Panagrolaimus davidi TaxID=227884 RepID=A0A914R936_9BILA
MYGVGLLDANENVSPRGIVERNAGPVQLVVAMKIRNLLQLKHEKIFMTSQEPLHEDVEKKFLSENDIHIFEKEYFHVKDFNEHVAYKPNSTKIKSKLFNSFCEFHKEFADNCDHLLQTKRSKPSKLVSTDVATSEQSDIVYSQLSQIRKLNQTIDL